MMDPPIKLFGRTIAFTSSVSSQDDGHDAGATLSTGTWTEIPTSSAPVMECAGESSAASEVTETILRRSECSTGCKPELSSSGSTSGAEEKPLLRCAEAGGGAGAKDEGGVLKRSLGDESPTSVSVGKKEGRERERERESEENGKGDKVLRRPDKPVACPRCHSLETKFCYYNNYNINQPRHFCKQCQRYWTAGGTLRNVPVGAGRRKNKHGGVTAPRGQGGEGGSVRGDAPDVASPLIPKTETYGVRIPIPMVPTATTTDSLSVTPPGSVVTGSDGSKFPQRQGSSDNEVSADGCVGWQAKDESACSSLTAVPVPLPIHECKVEMIQVQKAVGMGMDVSPSWSSAGPTANHQTVQHPASASATPYGFFNGAWPYGFNVNVGWNGATAFPPGSTVTGTAWSGGTASVWPGVGVGVGVPWALPGLAWGPAGWGPPWAMPWAAIGAAAAPAASMAGVGVALPPGSLTSTVALPSPVPTAGSAPLPTSLGKHLRNGENGRGEGALWAPKSLRMADSEEAMRSSVWKSIGMGSRADSSGSMFKAFQPKSENRKVKDDDQSLHGQSLMHANPAAAVSRSMNFQESSYK